MPANLEPLDGGVQMPYNFRCPISLELMRDPVTVCTGLTYDRSSIESWIATGNSTCPVSRAPLTDFALIPNHTLRRLIQGWCVANRSSGIERIPTPKQPAESVLVRSLLKQASPGPGPYGLRLSALRRLRGLASDSEKNRSVIAANSAREILLSVVFEDVGSESSEFNHESLAELNHESLAILSMFTLSEPECIHVASDSKRVGHLVNLLFQSSIEVRVNAAAVIENMLAGIRSPELRAQISNAERVFEGVVGILNYPLVYPKATTIGIKALFALCSVEHHRHKAVAAGAVEALIDRLAELEKCDSERALATAELLCRIPSGCTAFEAHALTVPLLVKSILSVSDRATECAAGSLLSLCSASERVQSDAVAAGVLAQLLLLVQSDCSVRAKREAQMLLKLLCEKWAHQSIAKSNYFAGCDVVPF